MNELSEFSEFSEFLKAGEKKMKVFYKNNNNKYKLRHDFSHDLVPSTTFDIDPCNSCS